MHQASSADENIAHAHLHHLHGAAVYTASERERLVSRLSPTTSYSRSDGHEAIP